MPARASISQHRADTPLQPEQFSCLLRNHPNRTFVNSLITSLTHSFDIGYSGTRTLRISPNLKSAFEHKDIVQQSLDTECERGDMAGPYEVLPMSNLQCSGLGVVPQKNGSWRLIMHLSAPLGLSINDGIDPDDYHLRYKKIDDAIAMIRELGPGCSMAKIDLKHAFRLCPVRRQDWDLLGIEWEGHFYVDKRLPFCLRPSSTGWQTPSSGSWSTSTEYPTFFTISTTSFSLNRMQPLVKPPWLGSRRPLPG